MVAEDMQPLQVFSIFVEFRRCSVVAIFYRVYTVATVVAARTTAMMPIFSVPAHFFAAIAKMASGFENIDGGQNGKISRHAGVMKNDVSDEQPQ